MTQLWSDAVRRSIASGSAAVAASATLLFDWPGMGLTRGAAAAALLASAIAVRRQHVGAQLFARGAWLSALILTALNAVYGYAGELPVTLTVGAGAVGALLAVGRRGLEADAPAGPFRPVLFRGALVAAIAMAMADAASLLFYGVAWLDVSGAIKSPLVLGAIASAGIFGLFRLRAWGLLLAFATNVVVALTALTGALAVPIAVRGVLAITAALQIALLLPVLRAAARGAGRPRLERVESAVGVARRIRVSGAAAGAAVVFECDGDEAEAEAHGGARRVLKQRA